MIADDDFTLYSDGGFLLASLPDAATTGQFWDKFNDELSDQTNSKTTATITANGRILRVLTLEGNRPFAYHYAVLPTVIGQSVDVRLQPITAWSLRIGHPDETEGMLAADATPRLPGLKTKLKAAATAAAAAL